MDTKCLMILLLVTNCNAVDQENLTGRDVRIFKDTPVWEAAVAIRDNDTAKLRKFLEGKPSSVLDFREAHFGQTLLNWAVYRDNLHSAKILVELGADPNVKSTDSTSAIIHAADKTESDYLRLMLTAGGDPNAVADIARPQDLRTPLMAAAFKSLENVKLLVEAGADANYIHRSKRGNIGGETVQSALIYAFRGDKIDIVKYLIVDVGVKFDYVFNTTLEGKPLTILTYLRNMTFPLDSEQHKLKMEVVAYLKSKGLDYANEPIPPRLHEKYDQSYVER